MRRKFYFLQEKQITKRCGKSATPSKPSPISRKIGSENSRRDGRLSLLKIFSQLDLPSYLRYP
jgi:hypothetical protein